MKFLPILFLAIPLLLQAEEPKASSSPTSPEKASSKDALKGKLGDFLKKIDKDGDGKLSDEEKEALHTRAKKEVMDRYDKDGDGKLSDEEKAKAKADGNKLLKKDKDGNDSEATQKLKAQLSKRYDKNGDGKLDEEEKEAATAALKKLKDKAKAEKSASSDSKTTPSAKPTPPATPAPLPAPAGTDKK